MNVTMKRLLSLLLCFVMLIGVVPASVFAEESTFEESAVVEMAAETVAETTEETEPEEPAKPVGPRGLGQEEKAEKPGKPEKEEKPGKPEPPKPEHEKPGKPGEETVPVTEETVPETTEETVPETTEETVPETTEETVPETTEETVPETSEETESEETEFAMTWALPRAGAVDAAIFFSDLHSTSKDAKKNYTDEIFGGIAQKTGLNFSSVTSIGDVFSSNESANHGNVSTITANIRSALGNANIPVLYTWSDHDRDAGIENKTGLIYGDNGTLNDTSDDAGYYIYAISMSDMTTNPRYSTNSTFNTSKLNDFTNTVAELDKSKPLFIASHMPLLDRRDDNGHAYEWYGVISDAAAEQDVIFLHGHNHKHDLEDDYYFAKGDTMNVATTNNTAVYGDPKLEAKEVELNFTHLCAGYMEPKSTTSYSNTSRMQVALVAIIREDTIQLTAYDKNGVYSGIGEVNVTFDRMQEAEEPDNTDPTDPPEGTEPPNPTDPPEGTEPSQPEASDVTIMDASGNVVEAEVAVNNESSVQDAVKDLLTNAVAYDIDIEGEVGDIVITLPIPQDVVNPAVYYVPDNEAPVDMQATKNDDGTVSFHTTHNSTYVVGERAATGDAALDPNKWEEVIPGSGGTTTYTYTLDTDQTIEANKKYLIVSANSGTGNALTNNNGSATSTQVQISNSTISVNDDSKIAWTFSANNGGKVTNGNHGLRLSSTSGFLSTTKNDMVVASKENGAYTIQRSGSNYYVRHNSGNWSRNSTASTLYLYALTGTTTSGATGAVYGQLVGPTEYQVPLGTTMTAALQKVKDGMTVYYSSSSSATTGSPDAEKDQNISWTMEEGYNSGVARTYTVTIKYKDKVLGTAEVEVVARTAQSVTLDRYEGIVERESGLTAETGAYLEVLWEGETEPERIPVTVGMLSGNYNVNKNGTYSGLSFSYGGETFENFTLKVVNKTGVNDYPVYPNPGSIDLKKSATGVDFQNTGIARVELSTSGLPASVGVDVVVVMDTGSSMTGTRIESAKTALNSMLNIFMNASKNEGADIDVAVVGFNGFNGTDFQQIPNASLNNSYRDTADSSKIYTSANGAVNTNVFTNGTHNLDASDFLSSSKLTTNMINTMVNYISAGKGTNYDVAFASAYRLLAAKKAANTSERQQFVVFMSDGAGFLYNGFMSSDSATDGTKDGRTIFNRWLTGEWATVDDLKAAINNNEFNHVTSGYDQQALLKRAEFYNGNGTNHPHRIAEAIKGAEGQKYTVVGSSFGAENNYMAQWDGLGAKIYSIGLAMKDDSNDGTVTKATLLEVIEVLSSGTGYHFADESESTLDAAFKKIAGEIRLAATNARLVDQMGDSFNLQLNPTITTNAGGSVGTTTTNTDIVITSRPVYTSENAPTTNDIGKPYSYGTTLETVEFAVSNGTMTATTSAGGYKLPNGTTVTANSTNILVGGVIYGKNFFYNNNNAAVTVTLANGSTYSLPGETFYWNIGTINETQYTIAYTVYLEGSMDGHRESGSYDTNNFATLYYTNHVGNEVNKSVGSPSLAWKGANVSYAFYLVNDDGEPVYADGTAAPNFLLSHKLTQPVVYQDVLLNATSGATLEARALAVLPEGYVLYDPTAAYNVVIGSGAGQGANPSHWTITGTAAKDTTYVMGYGEANDYSKEKNVNNNTYDYTHTIVYFAVKWVVGAVQDTVVVDYGLPVDINVMANDMFGTAGTLAAVGKRADKPEGHGTNLDTDFGPSVDGSFGNAVVKDGKVRYTLSSMQMKDAEKLAYAVNYAGATNPGHYYGDLTIIPATTIYYEDEFVALKTYTRSDAGAAYSEKTGWPVNSVTANGTQAEDRPGSFNLGTIDANNIYGYDQAYDQMSTHSMGNSAMIHVDANQYGTAEFSFWGTGFDVVSVTSNKTGTLVVQVYDANNQLVTLNGQKLSHAVDTFFGYTLNENDEWVVTEHTPNALYQVPVMQYADLPYAQYNVKISALYYPTFDATTDAGYDLYLDAIRIYDPAGEGNQTVSSNGDKNTTINDIYAQDGEAWPSYHELRNLIIAAEQVEGADGEIEGIVFIDGVGDTNAISDYTSYGPNNELYLASGESVAFNMNLGNATDHEGYVPVVRIGLKTVGNKTAVAEMWNPKVDSNGVVSRYNAISDTLQTATDMYYDITVLNKNTVVIHNSGEEGSILSITNIKLTYKPDTLSIPENTEGDDTTGDDTTGQDQQTKLKFSISKSTANAALMSLAPVQEEIPEESVPESSEPEESKPTEPVKPGKTDLKKAVDAAKKLKEKDYTKDSFQAVKSALKVAEKVLKNEKASQTQIEAAFEALESAVENLEVKPDNTGLKKAVDKAKKLKEKDYTKDSFKNFKNALKAAEKVLKNKNATQAEIDEALTELNESMSDLAKKSSGKKPGKR